MNILWNRRTIIENHNYMASQNLGLKCIGRVYTKAYETQHKDIEVARRRLVIVVKKVTLGSTLKGQHD